jgi:hypothetical protein
MAYNISFACLSPFLAPLHTFVYEPRVCPRPRALNPLFLDVPDATLPTHYLKVWTRGTADVHN